MAVYNGSAFIRTEDQAMPTLVIDNVPASLLQRIQHLAQLRQQKPAETVVEVLERALPATRAVLGDGPLPQEPFLTEEMGVPVAFHVQRANVLFPWRSSITCQGPTTYPPGNDRCSLFPRFLCLSRKAICSMTAPS